jgi:multiple sugar transport system substrate-binding protein
MDQTRAILNQQRISRRDFLKTTGVGLAGASLAGVLAAHTAPAAPKGTRLRILTWSHFVPSYDRWLDRFARDWGKKNGVRVRIDHIPHLEIPARVAAELAAGTGHDMFGRPGGDLVGLYYKHLLDITDLAERIGRQYGGWIPSAKNCGMIKGRWYGYPSFYIVIPMLWRKDLFDAEGLEPPDTWEKARIAARTLRPKGHPTGMQLSHCNDANHNWRSVLYDFGAKETDASGEHPLLDSKETREALKFAKALYDEGMTPEVFSWDDASDNRYLASGKACWIHDAISAYRSTQDTNPPVFEGTVVGNEPAGPTGLRFNVCDPVVYSIWKFAKNASAALAFLEALEARQVEAQTAARGYNMPFLQDQYKKPMTILGHEPKLEILQDFGNIVAFFGYPGPMSPAATEVQARYIIPDMFTRYVRTGNLEGTMQWAMGEIRSIYAKHKAMGTF